MPSLTPNEDSAECILKYCTANQSTAKGTGTLETKKVTQNVTGMIDTAYIRSNKRAKRGAKNLVLGLRLTSNAKF